MGNTSAVHIPMSVIAVSNHEDKKHLLSELKSQHNSSEKNEKKYVRPRTPNVVIVQKPKTPIDTERKQVREHTRQGRILLKRFIDRCSGKIMRLDLAENKKIATVISTGRLLKALCGFINSMYTQNAKLIVYKKENNDGINQNMHPSLFGFQSTDVSPMTIPVYIRRLFFYSEMSVTSLLTAICILLRFYFRVPSEKFPKNLLTFHRTFLASVSVAIKLCDDYHRDADHFSRVSGLNNVTELLCLEVEFIILVLNETFVSSDVLAQVFDCFSDALPLLDKCNVYADPTTLSDESDLWPPDLYKSVYSQLSNLFTPKT